MAYFVREGLVAQYVLSCAHAIPRSIPKLSKLVIPCGSRPSYWLLVERGGGRGWQWRIQGDLGAQPPPPMSESPSKWIAGSCLRCLWNRDPAPFHPLNDILDPPLEKGGTLPHYTYDTLDFTRNVRGPCLTELRKLPLLPYWQISGNINLNPWTSLHTPPLIRSGALDFQWQFLMPAVVQSEQWYPMCDPRTCRAWMFGKMLGRTSKTSI